MNVRSAYLSARKFQELLREERETHATYDRSPRRRLWLWRRGFRTRSDVLYDLTDRTYLRYLTDFERYVRTKQINGGWAITLDNKLIFHWMLGSFEEHRPAVYGLITNERFHPVDSLSPASDGGPVAPAEPPTGVAVDGRSAVDAAARVTELLREEGRLVLKWVKGGGGNNVLVCEWDGGPVVNGDRLSPDAFGRKVQSLEEYIVCEFVEQSAFGDRLFPETSNTFRVITMYDEERGEPFAPIAIYRIGSERSRPVDNFSRGGLNAEIDVETGELGEAAQIPEPTRVQWHDRHPDSGAAIAGETVPGWEAIREKLLRIAAAFPQTPYVGWDVVPTDEDGGFEIIEANSYPGMKAMQVHRPLLADERAERFYDAHGALIWDR